MSTLDPEHRISIWSVPERWRKMFFAIFSTQTAAIIALAVWYEIFVVTGDSWPETIFAITGDTGPAVAVIAAESIIVTEVLFVVIFGGMVERYQNRLKQSRAEGEAQGIAQGEAQGRARERERWEAWNRRRLEAEASGQPFDEPPPSASQDGEKPDGE